MPVTVTNTPRPPLLHLAACCALLWCGLVSLAAIVVPEDLPEAVNIIASLTAIYCLSVFIAQRRAYRAEAAALLADDLVPASDTAPFPISKCVPASARQIPSNPQ